MEEKQLPTEEVKSEEELQYEKRAPAITSFVFAILSYVKAFSLLSLIFAILSLVFAGKAKGVKTTSHKVFTNISKPVSIIMIILNIVVPIVVTAMVCFFVGLYIIVIIATVGLNALLA